MRVAKMFQIAADEWRQTRVISRWTLFLVPLALALLIIGIYARGTLLDIPTAVADSDNSALSRQFTRMLDAHRFLRVVDTVDSPEAAFQDLRMRKVFVVVVIPSGFEADCLSGHQARARVYHYGANMMIGKTVLKAVSEVTKQISAEHTAALVMAGRGESAFTAENTPPLAIDWRNLYNPPYNYLWMLPAGVIITLWQMFMVIWAVNVRLGAHIRPDRPQANVLKEMVGRLMPAGIVMSLQWIVLFYVLLPILQVPVRGSFVHGFGDWLLFMFTCFTLGYGASVLTGNKLASSAMALSLTAPAFAFSGYTYPFHQMPWPHQLFAQLMPSTHYLPALMGFYYQGTPWSWIYPKGLAVLFVLLLILTLIVHYLQRRRQHHV